MIVVIRAEKEKLDEMYELLGGVVENYIGAPWEAGFNEDLVEYFGSEETAREVMKAYTTGKMTEITGWLKIQILRLIDDFWAYFYEDEDREERLYEKLADEFLVYELRV